MIQLPLLIYKLPLYRYTTNINISKYQVMKGNTNDARDPREYPVMPKDARKNLWMHKRDRTAPGRIQVIVHSIVQLPEIKIINKINKKITNIRNTYFIIYFETV
jgi:hypothetical protein